jgi:hypothetical protein
MSGDGACWVVFAVVWCDHCNGDRPHAGPYCQTCGADVDDPEPGGRPDWVGSTRQRPVPPWEPEP